MTTKDFSVGDRVELHPATDAWMRGDRYATVTKTGRKYVHVLSDHGNRYACEPRDIFAKVEEGRKVIL
jgi:hypothetical protein